MKKAVLKLNLHDDKSKKKAMKIVSGLSVIQHLTCLGLHETGDSRTVSKKKAMKIVSGLSGVDSISMDMKDHKLTVIGELDPVDAVRKLRKLCHTEIVSVGPAKEPEKKKEEPKKKEDAVVEWVKAYPAYNPQIPHYYFN